MSKKKKRKKRIFVELKFFVTIFSQEVAIFSMFGLKLSN